MYFIVPDIWNENECLIMIEIQYMSKWCNPLYKKVTNSKKWLKPIFIVLVREPAILLIKWLRPKGLKVWFYVEKYAEFKNQTLKKIGWYTKMLSAAKYPGVGNISN